MPRHANGDPLFRVLPFRDIRIIIHYLHPARCKVSRKHPLLDTPYKNRLAISECAIVAIYLGRERIRRDESENSSSKNIRGYLNTAEEHRTA